MFEQSKEITIKQINYLTDILILKSIDINTFVNAHGFNFVDEITMDEFDDILEDAKEAFDGS